MIIGSPKAEQVPGSQFPVDVAAAPPCGQHSLSVSLRSAPGPGSVESVGSVRTASTGNPEPGTGNPLPLRREPKIKLPAGTASKQLKPGQKIELSALAAAAYERALTHYATDDLKLAAWRQRESIKAAGLRISEAEQQHYNLIKAHFQALAGESGKAFDAHIREHASPERVARFKLDQELTKHGLAESYAAHIARCRFKQQDLAKLTAKQLWSLVYDIRRTHTKKKLAAKVPGSGFPVPSLGSVGSVGSVRSDSTGNPEPGTLNLIRP